MRIREWLRCQKQRLWDWYSYIPYRNMSESDCESFLRGAGYPFPPLWKDMDSLTPTSLQLTVVIPVYNGERYLAKCLESICTQNTTCQYEVICIDDGSTDSSPEILRHYQKRYPQTIRVIRQSNRGISSARNRGIAEARGEYIGFMDNDDYVSADYVTQVMDLAHESNADMVQTGYKRVSPDGQELSQECLETCILTEKDVRQRLEKVHGYIWGGCLRKSVFESIRFPVGFWYEDMITRLLLMRKCPTIAILGATPYCYLVHETNASKVLWKKQSVKTADQYWLARSLSELRLKGEAGIDLTLYEVLIEEFGHMLWWRTLQLEEPLRRRLFLLAGYYLRSLHFEYSEGDAAHQAVNKALLSKDYFQWLRVASKNA